MADGEALGLLVNAKAAITNLYNDVFNKLTGSRATNLDNLSNIAAGPVALQHNLGTVGDPPAMNTSLDAALVFVFQQLYGIDAQLRQLAASQVTVYTGVSRQASALVSAGGSSVALSLTNGFITWNTSTFGNPIRSVKVFSPVIPAMHLIPPASGGPGYAQTLQMVVNGGVPGSSSPISLCGLTTSMIAGSPNIVLGWNGSTFTITSFNGTTAFVVSLPASIYPLTILWSAGGLTWTTGTGVQGTIAAGSLPSPNALYNLELWSGAGVQLVALGYI